MNVGVSVGPRFCWLRRLKQERALGWSLAIMRRMRYRRRRLGTILGRLLESQKRHNDDTQAQTTTSTPIFWSQEFLQISDYTRARLRRKALAITETELKLIAAAASIGLSKIPKNG